MTCEGSKESWMSFGAACSLWPCFSAAAGKQVVSFQIMLRRGGGHWAFGSHLACTFMHISRGRNILFQLGGFSVVVIIVALFLPPARPEGGGGGAGLLLSRGGEGGRGFWTQNLVYQKWPDQIFPIVNFVFSHYGHIGLGRGGGGFGGGVPPPWFLIILKKPWGGGYVGYIRNALEKGYSEHPRSACCTDDGFQIFVRFGRCLCCSLPHFVNRQLPCLFTNSHQVLLLPPMHHRSLWFAKEHALGLKLGRLILKTCSPILALSV